MSRTAVQTCTYRYTYANAHSCMCEQSPVHLYAYMLVAHVTDSGRTSFPSDSAAISATCLVLSIGMHIRVTESFPTFWVPLPRYYPHWRSPSWGPGSLGGLRQRRWPACAFFRSRGDAVLVRCLLPPLCLGIHFRRRCPYRVSLSWAPRRPRGAIGEQDRPDPTRQYRLLRWRLC